MAFFTASYAASPADTSVRMPTTSAAALIPAKPSTVRMLHPVISPNRTAKNPLEAAAMQIMTQSTMPRHSSICTTPAKAASLADESEFPLKKIAAARTEISFLACSEIPSFASSAFFKRSPQPAFSASRLTDWNISSWLSGSTLASSSRSASSSCGEAVCAIFCSISCVFWMAPSIKSVSCPCSSCISFDAAKLCMETRYFKSETIWNWAAVSSPHCLSISWNTAIFRFMPSYSSFRLLILEDRLPTICSNSPVRAAISSPSVLRIVSSTESPW